MKKQRMMPMLNSWKVWSTLLTMWTGREKEQQK